MKAIGPVGLFLLSLASACSLYASTDSRVFSFMAERRICYDQTDASTVLPAEYDTYQGCVGIYESGPESFFSTVALTWPDSSTTNIEMETDNDQLGWWAYNEYDTVEELNARYPVGNYRLTTTKAAGGSTIVDFTIETLDLPSAPMVTNYDDLQAINASVDTAITWAAWDEGTTTDFIIINIDDGEDDVYTNRDEIINGELRANGTTVSATIPAGTLASNTTYYLTVQFVKTYGFQLTNGVPDFPSAFICASGESQTSLTIRTATRLSPFTPTDSVGGKWDNMWGWIDDTYFPWVYSYGLDIWIYVYDGDVVDISKGYWVCYLLPDASDFGWGFAYASGGWWCITSDNVTHWLTPQDHLPVLIR